MEKTEILNQVRKLCPSARFPKKMGFSIKNDCLIITVAQDGLVSNMQTDESAFEGWAVCLKSLLPQYIQNVEIAGNVPDMMSANQLEHYNRFVYRLYKFCEIYQWAYTTDFTNEVQRINSLQLVINVPLKDASQTASHGEAKYERIYCAENNDKFDAMDHQLPVHLFKDSISSANTITPGSFLDIWSIIDGTLRIYELKLPTNTHIGIISELMFYVDVWTDIMLGKITIPTTSRYRSFDQLVRLKNTNGCEQIIGIFLADRLHSLFACQLSKVLSLLNNGCFGMKVSFDYQKTNLPPL